MAFPNTQNTRTIPPYEGVTGSPVDHAALDNLTWTVSGHVGTGLTLAGFDAVGEAAYYSTSDFASATHTHVLDDIDPTSIGNGLVLTRSGSGWIGTNLANYALVSSLSAVATSGSASDLSSGTLPVARLPVSGVTAGTYNTPSITVDAYGRITAVSAGGGGGGADTVLRQAVELDALWKTALADGYSEFTYSSGDLTQVDVWEDNGKTLKLFTRVLAYNTGDLATVTTTDEISGAILTKTLTYTGGYGSGGDLFSVTRAVT